MRDEISKQEILRLTDAKTGRAIQQARWDNIYRMWESGHTFEEIGKWIGRSSSTVIQLLKQTARRRQKLPGFKWPVDRLGRKICNVAHPMPLGERPERWAHARSRPLLNKTAHKKLAKAHPRAQSGYCPVCRSTFVFDPAKSCS